MDSLARLQEEQKKKFARLKMKQAGGNLQKESTNSSLFGVSDDLNLSVGDVSSSSSVGLNATLEAANTEMRNEMRELKDETGRLRKALAERNYEIKMLNKKISRCEEEKRLLSDAGLATDSASTKIVELSKKNRELSSQMESEKSRNIRLQQRVNELERKVLQNPDRTEENTRWTRSDLNLSYSSKQPLSAEARDNLQEQLNSANLKISEYRNQVQSLKQDMKVALKVLSQETGEDHASIQALLNNSGQGFRGRAQQVIALQDKVRDLEHKLKADLDLNPKVDRNVQRIKTIERSRKEQHDILKENLSTVQEQYAEVQRKWDATKARNKVLTSEIKSLKSQMTVLTEKGSHDNELIETLMKQQENLQKLLERSSSMKENIKRELVVNKGSSDVIRQESSEIKRLKEMLADRDQRVKELEEKVINTADSLDASHTPLSVFSSSAKSTSPNSRNISSGGDDIGTLRRQHVEMKSLLHTAEIERLHLGRMVASLSTRNEELIRQHEQLVSNCHDLKRKCVSLERQLDDLKGSDKSLTARDSTRVSASELEAQLLIQRDENNALKEALETTLRNKQSDANMYQEMNQQTKQVFLDALKSISSKQ